MAKINGNEIRPGMVIEYQDTLWVAVKTMAVKPGKGPAYNQVELKNLIDGRKLNNRFGSDERVERVRLEQKDFQFLYRQGESLVFMDNDTYEQTRTARGFRRRARGLPAGRHDGDARNARRAPDQHQAAGLCDARRSSRPIRS